MGFGVKKNDKNEKKQIRVYSFCTSAIGQVLRIALQDPALLYLDLYREASLCLYRLNTFFFAREKSGVVLC